MTLPTAAQFTLRFAVTTEPLPSSMENIVNLLARSMTRGHQMIHTCLRFRTPQSQSCGNGHAQE